MNEYEKQIFDSTHKRPKPIKSIDEHEWSDDDVTECFVNMRGNISLSLRVSELDIGEKDVEAMAAHFGFDLAKREEG